MMLFGEGTANLRNLASIPPTRI